MCVCVCVFVPVCVGVCLHYIYTPLEYSTIYMYKGTPTWSTLAHARSPSDARAAREGRPLDDVVLELAVWQLLLALCTSKAALLQTPLHPGAGSTGKSAGGGKALGSVAAVSGGGARNGSGSTGGSGSGSCAVDSDGEGGGDGEGASSSGVGSGGSANEKEKEKERECASACLRSLRLQRASLAEEWRRGACRIASRGAAFAQSKIDAINAAGAANASRGSGAGAGGDGAAASGAAAARRQQRGKPAARPVFARPVRKKPNKKKV